MVGAGGSRSGVVLGRVRLELVGCAAQEPRPVGCRGLWVCER